MTQYYAIRNKKMSQIMLEVKNGEKNIVSAVLEINELFLTSEEIKVSQENQIELMVMDMMNDHGVIAVKAKQEGAE